MVESINSTSSVIFAFLVAWVGPGVFWYHPARASSQFAKRTPKTFRPTQYVGGAAQKTAVEAYSALVKRVEKDRPLQLHQPAPCFPGFHLKVNIERPFTDSSVIDSSTSPTISQTQRVSTVIATVLPERVHPPTVPIESRESPSSDPIITSRCVACAFHIPN